MGSGRRAASARSFVFSQVAGTGHGERPPPSTAVPACRPGPIPGARGPIGGRVAPPAGGPGERPASREAGRGSRGRIRAGRRQDGGPDDNSPIAKM